MMMVSNIVPVIPVILQGTAYGQIQIINEKVFAFPLTNGI